MSNPVKDATDKLNEEVGKIPAIDPTNSIELEKTVDYINHIMEHFRNLRAMFQNSETVTKIVEEMTAASEETKNLATAVALMSLSAVVHASTSLDVLSPREDLSKS